MRQRQNGKNNNKQQNKNRQVKHSIRPAACTNRQKGKNRPSDTQQHANDGGAAREQTDERCSYFVVSTYGAAETIAELLFFFNFNVKVCGIRR